MTYEEYQNTINAVLSSPDTALANINPVLDAIKEDITALEACKEENSRLEARIRDLQDTNMKLFLGQTGQREEEELPKDPPKGQDAINAFLDRVFKEED